jgi:hypothetical protein
MLYLEEADVVSILTKALTAEHEIIFTNQTSTMGANTAFARSFSILVRTGTPNISMHHFDFDQVDKI